MARKKPTPKTQKKDVNRGMEIKRDDSVKNISIGVMDMDAAIMYYFEKSSVNLGYNFCTFLVDFPL